MRDVLWLGIIYGGILNLTGFLSMGLDKRRARQGAWRISERGLFLIAILGGSLGSILGMQVFRHKTKKNRFVIGMPVILAIQLILLGIFFCLFRETEVRRTEFAMGTVISEVVCGRDSEMAAEEIYQRIFTLEEQELSWRAGGSSVDEWNQCLARGEAVTLSGQEQQWIQDTLAICRDSGGALDITIHPVIDLWGMEEETPVVPSGAAIQEAMAKVGYERLHITDGVLTGDGTSCSIDLGAVGKGIAGDTVRDYLETTSVSGAVISIGGTIVVYGEKPGADDWTVGIQDPRGSQGTVFGVLTMEQDGIVSTSGDYEKYFIDQGIRYHHIFDPATGRPADSGLISVTVISDSGLMSDGLSTACFVLGLEEGMNLLEQYGAQGIFVTQDDQVYVTEGLDTAFTVTNPAYELQ